jgi:hypothetical protein
MLIIKHKLLTSIELNSLPLAAKAKHFVVPVLLGAELLKIKK